jgi:hypothetical protein
MPTRRIWRYRQRVKPLTAFQWAFFLVQDIAGFDRLAEVQGDDAGEFFVLYYADGWKKTYSQHQEEIEAEWRKRGWTQRQRRFVMTAYRERGFVLEHDRRSEREMVWWREWSAAEGWKTEPFPQYLERMHRKYG